MRIDVRSLTLQKTNMNSGETIRANAELRCSVRLSGSELRIARGVTEELTRETIVLVMSSTAGNRWLRAAADVLIAIELPFAGKFEPRVLECAARISGVNTFANGVRIVAEVHRMAVVNYEPKTRRRNRPAGHSCAAEHSGAVARPQNNNPVIRMNHRTNSNSNPTGEQTMTFLKNFFNEEDGQDMVEYGLVIALVVVGGVTAFTAFGSSIKTSLGNVFTSIEAGL